MIKAIIFDIGGVLLKGRFEEVYKKLAENLGVDSEKLGELQGKYQQEMLNGEISAEKFVNIIKDEFDLKLDVLKIWKESYLEVMSINEELLELADNLREKYRVAVITNAPKLHAQINKERGLFSHFDPALISCDIGLVKPQKEIFELVLVKLSLKVDECVFIDDREKHLSIPREMGFQIIHFRDNQQLIKDLRKLDIDF